MTTQNNTGLELLAIVLACVFFINNKDGVDLLDAIISLVGRL